MSARRAAALLAGLLATVPAAAAAPPSLLFVGNSFTHARYEPARSFGAGYGPGDGHVHDLLCPDPARCVPPERKRPPRTEGTVEYGPYGGVPGLVLAFLRESGRPAEVGIEAVSGGNLGRDAEDPALLAPILIDPDTGRPWETVVLQEQSFLPLPPRNALGRATRGDPDAFAAHVRRLVEAIHAADAAAHRPPATIFLYAPQPIAADTYRSDNPARDLVTRRHGRTVARPTPYLGLSIGAEARDIDASYRQVASAVPGIAGAAPVGLAWLAAIRQGTAQRDPFAASEPAGEVDLWDDDVRAACCVVPIGYHPSRYGAYLDALTLFGAITGLDPRRLGAGEASASALGIAPPVAAALQRAAATALGR